MLSIIIPTYNEEKFLPKLLKSLEEQKFKDYELIIADNRSTDNTIEIAKMFNAKIVKGGTPSVGRNLGASHATGEMLLFIDSDVVLTKGFIKKALKEIKNRKLDITICEFDPIEATLDKKLIFKWVNASIRIASYTKKPFGYGACMFVKRELYDKVGGFDEKIVYGEDSEFLAKCSKIAKYAMLNNVKAKISSRRYDKEGFLRASIKVVVNGIHRYTKGEIKKEIVKYEFGKHDDVKKHKKMKERMKDISKRIKQQDLSKLSAVELKDLLLEIARILLD